MHHHPWAAKIRAIIKPAGTGLLTGGLAGAGLCMHVRKTTNVLYIMLPLCCCAEGGVRLP